MKRINRLLRVLLLGVGLGIAQGASAIPIGPGETPALESVASPFLSLPLEGGGLALFYIAFAGEPISADPAAGVWLKYLPLFPSEFPDQVGIAADPGPILGLLEFATVGEGPAWRDWHERILTPGWEWITGALPGEVPLSLPTIFLDMLVAPNFDFTVNGSDIAFNFDPLQPGTQIAIVKLLRCTDTQICFDNEGFVAIAEYPSVPEPATLALLALGLAGLGFSRRRQ